jgi:hypothetical protein
MISTGSAGTYNLALYTLSGRKLLDQSQMFDHTGVHSVPFAVNSLSKGLYLIVIRKGTRNIISMVMNH